MTYTPPSGAWTARWIEPLEHDPSLTAFRPAHHLAGELDIEGEIAQATLHVTAHGVYEAFVNGQRISDVELAPGFTSYATRLQVHTHDITGLLRSGTNAVGALVSDGWWRGLHGMVRSPNAYGHRTGLLAELHVVLASGETMVWGTDGTWRSTPSHITGADLMMGETHDLRRTVAGWADPGTDRTAWDQVTVADTDYENLIAVVGPPTRRIEELPARTITTLPEGGIVVDFGQNSNGWIRLTNLGPAETELTIRYGEWLDPATGALTQDHIAGLESGTSEANVLERFQTDIVTSAGDGATFEPRHSTKGFQYVQIDGHPGPLTTDDIASIVVHTDLTPVGGFTCSDERIQDLHRAAVWSFRGNACEIPTDCPTRERSGWVGDWQIYVATAAELFDVTDWSIRWLADLAADQLPSGAVTSIVPDPNPQYEIWSGGHGSAGWGDAAVHVPWELHRTSGRTDFIADELACMRRWVDFGATLAALGRHESRRERNAEPLAHEQFIWDVGWHYGEWLEPGADMDDFVTELLLADHGPVATAYLHRSAHELSQLAALVGDDATAERYGSLAASTLDAWRTEFLDDDGRVQPQTQANLVRGIAFGLVPDDLVPQAADDLVALVRAADTHLGTGFLATPYLLPVLADTGHLDVAYELLYQDTEPSWLRMIDAGSTTVWEDWDGVSEAGIPRHSLNHYSKGAVISFLHRYTAGVELTEPGYRRFRVAPRPGGSITSATYWHDTPHGRIETSWAITDGTAELELTVPTGTQADVALPDGTEHAAPAGTHRFTWTA